MNTYHEGSFDLFPGGGEWQLAKYDPHVQRQGFSSKGTPPWCGSKAGIDTPTTGWIQREFLYITDCEQKETDSDGNVIVKRYQTKNIIRLTHLNGGTRRVQWHYFQAGRDPALAMVNGQRTNQSRVSLSTSVLVVGQNIRLPCDNPS